MSDDEWLDETIAKLVKDHRVRAEEWILPEAARRLWDDETARLDVLYGVDNYSLETLYAAIGRRLMAEYPQLLNPLHNRGNP